MFLLSAGVVLSTAIIFIFGFVLLFIIYYVTSPLYTEYGDARSRLVYSLINSFYFSLVLAILFAMLPWLSAQFGVLASLVGGCLVIIASTLIQVFAITTLVRKGFLKIRQKPRKARAK